MTHPVWTRALSALAAADAEAAIIDDIGRPFPERDAANDRYVDQVDQLVVALRLLKLDGTLARITTFLEAEDGGSDPLVIITYLAGFVALEAAVAAALWLW